MGAGPAIDAPGAGARDYDRLRRAAGRNGLPVAAYLRMSVMERVCDDERRAGIWEMDHLGMADRGEG